MNGSSQNAYLIEEEKTVLIDTVWTPHRFDFVEDLKREIDLKKIDFIVANHGECDHSGSLTALMDEIPDTPIYCTAQAVKKTASAIARSKDRLGGITPMLTASVFLRTTYRIIAIYQYYGGVK